MPSLTETSHLHTKYRDREGTSHQEEATQALSEDVYSVFSPSAKRLIVLTASTAAFLSPLASNIYLPTLNLIAADLHVSDSQVTLTVTSYLIFQALSPLVVAGFSDHAGRRPAYISCFILYIGANVALSLQNSYIGLLILRCFQSAGSSAMVALCQGVVADVATIADRGNYVAYASVSTILGPTLSPVLGGLISQSFGWKGIFWFLAGFAVLVCAVLLLYLPETCRKVVGNGSRPPRYLVHMTIQEWWQRERHLIYAAMEDEGDEEPLTEHHAFHFHDPLTALNILSDKGTLLLMIFVGMVFGIHYLILSTIPFQLGTLYQLNQNQLGLIYIPYGLGSIASAFTTGKLANWNYRRHAARLHFPVSDEKQVDLSRFPIEQARLEMAVPILYFGSIAVALYGWSLSLRAHILGLLVLLICIGYSVYALYQITALLIIDIYSENPATATAVNNLIRCSFAALSTACAVPLVNSVGSGWTNTFAACTAIIMGLILWTLMMHGPYWRQQAAIRLELRVALNNVCETPDQRSAAF